MSDMPEGWEWTKIGDLASSIGNGRSVPDGPDDGYPVLRLTAIRSGRIDIAACKKGAWTAEEANSFRIRKDDLLIARGNGSKRLVGRGAIVQEDSEVAFPDTMIRIRFYETKIHPKYAALIWDSPQVRAQIESRARTTAGIYKVSQKDLREINISLPPCDEQARIVAVIEEQFSRLDAGAVALARARKNLKLMRDASYGEVMTRFAGRSVPRARLGDVLREPLRNGHSAKADPNGAVPIITLGAVTSGDFGAHNLKMTAADPQRVRGLWLQPGDLLIERSNTRELVGTACLYRGIPNLAVYPDLIIRARVDSRVMPEYAELVLKAPSSRRYFQQRAQGIAGNMPKIDQRTIESFELALPSLEEQASIVREADRKLTLIRSLQTSLELAVRHTSTLRSAILSSAFSGNLMSRSLERVAV